MSKGRNWILTLNNPAEDAEAYLDNIHKTLKAVYTVGQLEKGKEGTPHLQFFMNFKEPIRAAKFKKQDSKIHYQLVKINNGADDYCMKDDTRVSGPWEYGKKPVKVNNKVDWDRVKTLAKAGNLEAIPSSIFVNKFNTLRQIAAAYAPVLDCAHVRGLWIWGNSGTGKSRVAREIGTKGGLYHKHCNLWWDGYQGERVVILDDLGLDHQSLGYNLKLWTDRYGITGQVKGSSISLNYTWFIITSQYSIREVFADNQTFDAISRRTETIRMEGQYDPTDRTSEVNDFILRHQI